MKRWEEETGDNGMAAYVTGPPWSETKQSGGHAFARFGENGACGGNGQEGGSPETTPAEKNSIRAAASHQQGQLQTPSKRKVGRGVLARVGKNSLNLQTHFDEGKKGDGPSLLGKLGKSELTQSSKGGGPSFEALRRARENGVINGRMGVTGLAIQGVRKNRVDGGHN